MRPDLWRVKTFVLMSGGLAGGGGGDEGDARGTGGGFRRGDAGTLQ